jgi:ribosome biogenesis protein Tsr3
MEPILVYLALAVFISLEAIREDGFKFIVYDRDRDGKVQEGTKWERKFFYINRSPLKKYRKNS